jgi:hypothetical protein
MQWSKYCIEDTKSAKNSKLFLFLKTIVHFFLIGQKQKVLNFLTIIKIIEKLLNCCYFVKETFIEIFRKFSNYCQN